jgi:hypothetical protein
MKKREACEANTYLLFNKSLQKFDQLIELKGGISPIFLDIIKPGHLKLPIKTSEAEKQEAYHNNIHNWYYPFSP